MARPGVMYPQVDAGAEALVGGSVAAGSARASAAQALEGCRRAGARALALGPRRLVRETELARAVAWGLGGMPARHFAWTALPAVDASASEIDIRRLLMAGAAMLMVRKGQRVVGLIDRESAGLGLPGLSLVGELEPVESAEGEARVWLLRVAGKVGEEMATAAFAVGGFVRDLVLRRPAPDVDLVVEGDGIAFARRLSEEIGGRLAIHAGFGTASIEDARAAGGRLLGRVDIASARRERYDQPGALPVVSPAGIAEDLARRDFSVNAMALSLSPSAFGKLVDPCGGRHDLKRRRLRPLHPLSFVEDPTRIFRAARYAARLGLHLDSDGWAALSLALRIGDYPCLSGQRLRGELDRLAREPRPQAGLELILRWQAPRLWDRGYRATPMAARRLHDAAHLQAWTRARDVALDPTDIALIALLMGQLPEVRRACLSRLAISGKRREILEAATARPLARLLAGAHRRSEIAEALRPLPVAVLAGAWLRAERPVRRDIEWYLREGRGMRPLLSGGDVVACGVPRGPAVGRCLAALSRARVDREVRSLGQERAFVKRWLADPGPMRARKEG